MNTGVVKFYNESKGYGFIKMDGSNQEIFVHATGVSEPIREADKVQFELKDGKKGLNAVNVRVI